VTTFDERVQDILKNQERSFSQGDLTLISAYELPTHIEGETGCIVTYSRSHPHQGVGRYHETRFFIQPGPSDKQTSGSGGILAQSWSKL
jgi:hypothetical protein